jgi:hypothetical protein
MIRCVPLHPITAEACLLPAVLQDIQQAAHTGLHGLYCCGSCSSGVVVTRRAPREFCLDACCEELAEAVTTAAAGPPQ